MRKPRNPVAKAVAINRRRSQVVAPKRGKGSYNRKKMSSDDKMENTNGMGRGKTFPKDSSEE